MKDDQPRTSEQIRAEIAAERAQLDAQLAALGAEAKRSGRIAGTALAALSGVLLLIRRRARSRSR